MITTQSTLDGSSEGDQSFLQVSVSDAGIGMTIEQFGKVYKQFYQADEVHTKRFAGIGLGLPIAQKLDACMGGTIQAESQLTKSAGSGSPSR